MHEPTGLRLHDGEEVIASARPSPFWSLRRLVLTLSLYEIWRRREVFAVTRDRIIHIKGIVHKTHQTVNLDRIQDVNMDTSILSGSRVQISTAGGQLSVRSTPVLSRQNARGIADAIEQHMSTHSSRAL